MLALYCFTVALLLCVLTAASPLKNNRSCMADSLLMILQDNGNDAVSYCQDVAASMTVTVIATTTAVWANTTVTNTVKSQPVMTITIDADAVTTITTTAICSETSKPPNNATTIVSTLEGVIDKREIAAPSYLRNFSPSQIASACGCLVVSGPTTTATAVVTITRVVPTATQVYTALVGTPALAFTTIVATMTFVETVCFDKSTTTSAREDPRKVGKIRTA